MLFDDLGSSGFADRLIDEKARIMSINELSEALRARSTRFFAMVASTLGSAERKRCNNMDIVKRVT
jgi:hypothetical protein